MGKRISKQQSPTSQVLWLCLRSQLLWLPPTLTPPSSLALSLRSPLGPSSPLSETGVKEDREGSDLEQSPDPGHMATLSSKGGWEVDIGRQLGVLATGAAGTWHLHLVTSHYRCGSGSTPLVVGAGSRGWPLWSLGFKARLLQGRPLGQGSLGVGSTPSQPSSHPLCQEEPGTSGDSVCPSTYQSPQCCRQRLFRLSDHMVQFLPPLHCNPGLVPVLSATWGQVPESRDLECNAL